MSDNSGPIIIWVVMERLTPHSKWCRVSSQRSESDARRVADRFLEKFLSRGVYNPEYKVFAYDWKAADQVPYEMWTADLDAWRAAHEYKPA